MSTALGTADETLLLDLAEMLHLLGSPREAPLRLLISRLEHLVHCDQCGVLFEGRISMTGSDECPHCVQTRRHDEAAEDVAMRAW